MIELVSPKCYKCNITFEKMDYMDLHMKREHQKSEYMRINRLSQAVKFVQIKQEPAENIIKKL